MGLTHILAGIGALSLLLLLVDNLWSVIELVVSYLAPYFQPNEETSLVKRFGSWAVVTGSTDGIGKQYALQLAKRGINVVLISRNHHKLQAVASEIEKSYSVKTKVIVADFSEGAKVYSHIAEELKDIPIGILVNNVGCNYDYPMPLCEVPESKAWELINVNVGAVTMMSRTLLPAMVSRRRGAIVNVSSGSENQPLPLMTVYAATKSYINSFTAAIREEYSNKGIYVQHLSPYFVSTKINNFSETVMNGNLLVPDVDTYARHAVGTLGRVSRTTGYWVHGLQCFAVKITPMWMRIKIGKFLNEQFRGEFMRNKKH